MKTTFNLIVFSLLINLFVACGGGSGSTDTTTTPTPIPTPTPTPPTPPIVTPETIDITSGIVVDNYIKNATVCIDSNKNNICDSTDVSTTSNDNGEFTFNQVIKNTDIIIAYYGKDNKTQEDFNFIVKNIGSNYSSNNKLILSSITTLIVDYMDVANVDLNTSKTAIVNFLGGSMQNISEEMSIEDIIANKSSQNEEFLRSLKIFQMVHQINTIDNFTQSAKSFISLAKFIKDNNSKKHSDNLTITKDDNTTVILNSNSYQAVVFSSLIYNYYTDLSPTNEFEIEAYDPDASSLSYSIVLGKDSDDFNISNNKLSFNPIPTYLNPSDSNFDGEYKVDVNISNANTSIIKTLIINVIKFNKSIKPTLSNSSISIEDNNTLNTIIGSVLVNSIGDSEIIKYELDQNNTYFDVNKSNGNIYIKSVPLPNVSSGTTQNEDLFIHAKNSAGWSDNAQVTIIIVEPGELNSTASLTNEIFETIYENNSSTQIVGTVTIASNGGNIVSDYNISSDTSGFFDINSSGVITTNNNFDYESKDSYTIQVIAKNINGFGNPATITIKIKDVNEAPSMTPAVTDQNVSYNTNKVLSFSINDGDNVDNQIVSISVNSSSSSIVSVSSSQNSITNSGNTNITLNGLNLGTSTITITLTDAAGTLNGGVDTISYDFNVTVRANGLKLYENQKASGYTIANVVFDGISYAWDASNNWYATANTILIPAIISNVYNVGSNFNSDKLEGHNDVNKSNMLNNSRIIASTQHNITNTYSTVSGGLQTANNNNFQYDPLHNLFVSRVILNNGGDSYEQYTYSQWTDANTSDGNNTSYVNAPDFNTSYSTDVNISTSYANTSVIIDSNNDGNSTDGLCAKNYGEGWRLPTSYEIGIDILSAEAYKGYIPAYLGHESADIISSTQHSVGNQWIIKSHSAYSRSGNDGTAYKVRCVYKP